MKTPQIQENLQEILKKDCLHASYLDKFSLDFGLPNITAIIPTFNRSPHSPEEDSNPLGWSLESLLAQKNSGLDEIIIVDDASTDYTKDVVRSFQEESSVPIVYLKNKNNLGSSISRNIAVRHSKNDLVMFLDDDCIFSRYMFFGANFTLNKLGDFVAALHLPVYHRKTVPDSVSIRDIGVLDLDRGIITGNYDGFPVEYMENLEDNLLEPNLKIVKPLEIKNLGGIFLIKKEVFKKIGGFPEFFTWKNGYREETDVALRLSENNYKMFFTPDPKFYCVHLKYGANGDEDKHENSGHVLGRLIEKSNIPRTGTGNRVDTKEWFYSFLLSTYTTLGRQNPNTATQFQYEMYKQFVVNNELSLAGTKSKIDGFKNRKDIFEKAIQEGGKLIGGIK
ncbi:glycosyltransferase family 2 protein [Candidatus Pacearchaeota archaeon]|nr:glycosyltransferase family 2 protein [Candidatus Pacearchaeota archaeon]